VTAAPVPPSIQLSATSRSFTAQAGAGNPASQTVNITNGGGGTLSGLTAPVSYGAGQPTGWLNASLNTTTAPATLTLAVTTGSLAAGTYTATVAVTSGVANNSPQNVMVTFTVTAAPVPPSIQLSVTSRSFTAQAGSGNPASQTVNITNGGGGTLSGLTVPVSYGAGQPTGWLNASLNTTTAPATLTLARDDGELGGGDVHGDGGGDIGGGEQQPAEREVTFTVTAAPVPPSIQLSVTSRSFTAQAGSGNPASQTVNITNGGGGTLSGLTVPVSYGAGQPTGWLNASLNTTTAPATLTLAVATGSLAAGTYTATVAVTSGVASNSPQNVAVTFTVTAPVPPSIQLSVTSRSFTAQAGAGNPASQTVSITNGGGGTLSGLTVPVSYGAGQPTGWLNASLSTTTAPATLTLAVTTGSLVAGTYTATVAVTSGVASNSPQNVSVTFTVTAAPLIHLSATSRSFTAQAGSGNPASQTVSITNGGGGTLSGLSAPVSYGVGQPTGWLNASLNTTTAPATLTLAVTTGSLAAGTYTATVAVTSGVAHNSPQNVAVTFDVTVPTYTLAVSRVGNGVGTVTSSPPGIDCGTDCTEDYAFGTVVTLTATASSGSVFGGWSGTCTGPGSTCQVTMSEARSLTATFNLSGGELGVGLGPEQWALIPAGTFQMGDMVGSGSSVELPVHTVNITKALLHAEDGGNAGQWWQVMGSNPSYFSSCGDTCPVDHVSWDDIQQFLSALNAQDPGRTTAFRRRRSGSTPPSWDDGDYGGTGVLDQMGWYSGQQRAARPTRWP
jgi:hypothetical protein